MRCVEEETKTREGKERRDGRREEGRWFWLRAGPYLLRTSGHIL